MKTFRIIALLALTTLAACAQSATAPETSAQTAPQSENGTGFLGGGTR
jgi:hypothetical protein